jgi:hypothetical protein
MFLGFHMMLRNFQLASEVKALDDVQLSQSQLNESIEKRLMIAKGRLNLE